MRKYLYAGAVASGFLLLGAAPAHADVQPAPAGALGGLLGSTGGLDPAGGLRIGDPLGGSGNLLDVDPGDNSADVPGAASSLLPAARTGLGRVIDRTPSGDARPADPAHRASTEDLPGVGGLPTGALGGLPVSNLPVSNLLGGLPMIGGLLPNGQSAGFSRADRESGLLGSELPLLVGLLPDGPGALGAPAASGLPAGGTAVPATPGQDEPAPGQPVNPAQDQPARPAAAAPAEDPATANDPRLHEEPTDPEGKGSSRRAFSDGRPVAGVDPDYK